MGSDKTQRESFLVYRSFEKKKLPDHQRLIYYDALFAYGLRQETPNFKDDVTLECIWDCVAPQIDANHRRYLNGLKGGKHGRLGGAPLGNNNASKAKQPQNNPKTTPNDNLKDNANDTDNVKDEVDINGSASHKTIPKKFIKPTEEELQKYCSSRGGKVDPVKFWNYYESVGWMVGKSPMKDWKAAVRYWEQNEIRQRNDNDKRTDPRFNISRVSEGADFAEAKDTI